MAINPPAAGPVGSLDPSAWRKGVGVTAGDGHALVAHPLGKDRYVYVDLVAKGALLCRQDLGAAPYSSRLVPERAPKPTEAARIWMSNLSGNRGDAFDGETFITSFATDTIATRDGGRFIAVIDARFAISASEHRIYVFDATDDKATRFPLVGCYDLAG